jgi:hypothetical protein
MTTIEDLRQQAERETAEHSGTRRPSWAPALALSGELLNVSRLNCSTWTRNRSLACGRFSLTRSGLAPGSARTSATVPLHGHRVRGFELIAGEQRTGSRLIYRSLKSESGDWGEGPRWVAPTPPDQGKGWALEGHRKCLAVPPPCDANGGWPVSTHSGPSAASTAMPAHAHGRLQGSASKRPHRARGVLSTGSLSLNFLHRGNLIRTIFIEVFLVWWWPSRS